MNLDAYLALVGVARPEAPSLEALRHLHVAHLAAFPFHNLTIQKRGAVTIDAESIAERFYAAGGGGYCFEQNTLFGAALVELGFRVTTLLGRVGPADRPLNHMLLRVDVDGRPWLADVGYGGQTPLEPLPLEDGARVTQAGIDYALRRDADHWTLAMVCGGESEDLYEFSGEPHTTTDVEAANLLTSTHPSSIFRKTLTIQRTTARERVILRPTMITRYRDGLRTDTAIEPAQLRALARELFGIELGEAPLLFEESLSS